MKVAGFGLLSLGRGLAFLLVLLLGLVSRTATATRIPVLTQGPVVGGVTAARALVFARTDAEAEVQIVYSTHADMTEADTSAAVVASADADFTVRIPIEPLEPRTKYFLNVLVGGVPQLAQPAHFSSFPPDNSSSHFKLVMLTDFGAGESSQPPLKKESPTFANAAAEHPDIVFLGGDFDHRDPQTLDAKRQMFKDLYGLHNPHARMDSFVEQILRQYPIAHHWDDHDYSANDTDRFAPDRAVSQRVFREYVPAYPLPSTSEIYQTFRYGNIDFFVLDNRSQRDPNATPDSPTKSMLDGEHLGKSGQLHWLLKGLRDSDARWKVIFSSSVFNPTTGKADTWRSFRHEHDSIVDYIHKHAIRNVLVLSGDIHAGALDDGTNGGLPEMVVPGANLAYCYTVPQANTGMWTHGTYGDPARNMNATPCNGYGVLNITDRRAKLIVKDQRGRVQLRMRIKNQAQ